MKWVSFFHARLRQILKRFKNATAYKLAALRGSIEFDASQLSSTRVERDFGASQLFLKIEPIKFGVSFWEILGS